MDFHSVLYFLDPAPTDKLKEIGDAPRVNANRYSYDIGPMQASTRKALDDFYQPFNEALAHIMEDQRFLWKDIHHDSSW